MKILTSGVYILIEKLRESDKNSRDCNEAGILEMIDFIQSNGFDNSKHFLCYPIAGKIQPICASLSSSLSKSISLNCSAGRTCCCIFGSCSALALLPWGQCERYLILLNVMHCYDYDNIHRSNADLDSPDESLADWLEDECEYWIIDGFHRKAVSLYS